MLPFFSGATSKSRLMAVLREWFFDVALVVQKVMLIQKLQLRIVWGFIQTSDALVYGSISMII